MSRTDSPAEPDTLLLFAPVQTAWRGANGWSAAARSVGRSPSSAYQLRRRAGEDGPFARAWDEARGRAGDEALDASMAGGMTRRWTELFHRGRHAGWRTAYDNRLAYAALRALDKRDARWAADGLDARVLLAEAMELPDGRAMCEASPGRGASAPAPSAPDQNTGSVSKSSNSRSESRRPPAKGQTWRWRGTFLA